MLVSIQSAILGVKFPVYNEPGVEAERGTARGRDMERTARNGGYEGLRLGTLRWGMLDMLRNPPAGFESVVKQHFLIKRAYIKRQVLVKWQREAAASDTGGYQRKVDKEVRARARGCVRVRSG